MLFLRYCRCIIYMLFTELDACLMWVCVVCSGCKHFVSEHYVYLHTPVDDLEF